MRAVTSDAVRAVGYDSGRRVLRVAFVSGGVYDYAGVEPAIYERMLLPHPWRDVGEVVLQHPFSKVR